MSVILEDRKHRLDDAGATIITDADFLVIVRTLAILSYDQNDDIKAALAWTIYNRIASNHASGQKRGAIPQICHMVLSEALSRPARRRAFSLLQQADWPALNAASELAGAETYADPTRGAVHCHRHEFNPAWARRKTPTALLGAFLFYR